MPKPFTLRLDFRTQVALQAFLATAIFDDEGYYMGCTPAGSGEPTPPPDTGTTPPNAPPTAVLQVMAGVLVTDVWLFDTTGTGDPEGAVASTVINWGDGTPDNTYPGGLPPLQVPHTFPSAGTFTVSLTIVDSSGLAQTAQVTVQVQVVPVAPIAALTFMSGAFTGSPVIVSTAGTTDPDGAIASWFITWGDGGPSDVGTGPPPATLQHTYAGAGTFPVVLTVTDNGVPPQQGTATMPVLVQAPAVGNPPVTSFALNSGTFLGDSFVFAIDGSDPELGALTWDLDYGDGSAHATGTGADFPTTRAHTYAAVGSVTAVFRVTDTQNLTTTKTLPVLVTAEPDPDPIPENLSPVAQLAPLSGQFATEPLILTTAGSFDPDDNAATWGLVWGDGSTPSGGSGLPDLQLTHIYATAGTYTAVLTITDTLGKVGTASVTVIIQSRPAAPQPPTASLTRTNGIFAGDTFTFALAGVDPDGTVAGWVLNFGDGSAPQTGVALPTTRTHVYTTAGSYSASLIVTDATGLSTSAALTVTVATVPLPDPTADAYFTLLSGLPQCILTKSLKDQAQLDSLVSRPPSVFWTYNPGSDTYPTPQNGAKLFKPPRDTFSQYPQFAAYGNSGDEGVHGNNALRFPLGVTSGSLFLTWDLWWGEEFQTNKAPGSFAFKVWFLFCGDGIGATKDYLCMHERYTGSPLPVAGAVSRHHDGPGGGKQLPLTSGVVDVDPFQPTGQSAPDTGMFLTYYSRWARYWVEIKLDQPGAAFTEWSAAYLGGTPLVGTYDMVSIWAADAVRPRARVTYRVPYKRPLNNNTLLPYTMLSAFRWAWDTSTNNLTPGTGLVGPLIAYGRNMVALHNLVVSEGDASLWPQPV